MKLKVQDICQIKRSWFDFFLFPPRARKFIKRTYCEVTREATHFLCGFLPEGDDVPWGNVDVAALTIDWEAGEISATASVYLKLKFVMKGDDISITDVGFED